MSSQLHRFMRKSLLLLGVVLFTIREAAAEDVIEIEVYTAAIPPYVTQQKGVLVGSLVPVVNQYLEERGFKANMSLLPWSAAFRRTIATPNSLLFPVDRTPAREELFHWLKPLVTTNYYLYGLKGTVDPDTTIADVIENGALVSCTLNSIQCEILLQNGVPDEKIMRIEGASIRRRLTLMVAERYYYTVFDPEVFADLTVRQSLASDELIQLHKIGEKKSYLAASKDMPGVLLERLSRKN